LPTRAVLVINVALFFAFNLRHLNLKLNVTLPQDLRKNEKAHITRMRLSFSSAPKPS
jgi:hypothetical protein